MGYKVSIIADSINPKGDRLFTVEATFPRIVLAEVNTFRMASKNSSSSRAVPCKKMIQRVLDDPFIPIWWGKNEKGMAASEEMSEKEREIATKVWLKARDNAVKSVNMLIGVDKVQDDGNIFEPGWALSENTLDTHKQIANRLLEPFMWHTAIISATDWGNFFNQRCDRAAQPEIRKAAEMICEAYYSHEPNLLNYGDWHLPFVTEEEKSTLELENQQKLSVARSARVSYLSHDGIRDLQADYGLFDKLKIGMHMSPAEHAAQATNTDYIGNFIGFTQLRKTLPNENRKEYIYKK